MLTYQKQTEILFCKFELIFLILHNCRAISLDYNAIAFLKSLF